MIWVRIIIGAVKTLIVLGAIQWVAPDLSYELGYTLTSFIGSDKGEQ